MLYGYGRILDVDLSTRRIERKDIAPEFAQKFIGSMGFSGKILYDEVGPDVDPLSPDNIVIFAVGPLTGTQMPCGARTEITTKSPLTGIIGSGNTGGEWGSELKHAGFDVIVVRNKAEKPVYLYIDDDVSEIREASHLWGKDTRATAEILKKELGPKFSVMAIGPAGENLVKYACTLNDYDHVAARNGAGAVLGTKRLKAIAVRGTKEVNVARPEEFREAVREARGRIAAATKGSMIQDVAQKFIAVDIRQELVERGGMPAKNYQTGVIPRFLETRGMDVNRKYLRGKKYTCHGCPMSCRDWAEVNEGKYAGLGLARAAHTGVVMTFGAECAIDNLPAIWKCKDLCQFFGMDYQSAAGSIAFAMELFQRGLISKRDTDGLELSWGNEDAVIEMIRKIAFREGFGNILADGSVRAAKIIGQGAEKYVMTTKGMEMMGFDPRSGRRGFAVGDLTSPRGGDNVKSTHCRADRYNPKWWVDNFDMFEDVKKKIYSMPPEETAYTWEGKSMFCKWFEDMYSVQNSFGVCFMTSGSTYALGPTYFSKLFSACTGWDTTPQGIMMSGERIFTLLKAYGIREGLTRKDDDWPERFYKEPLPEGPAKGAVLSRETIDRLLDEYYELRGWDKRLGVPSAKRLVELGLGDVANELLKLGRIPRG